MALNANEKKPCSKCGSTGRVFPCDGCHASFCVKHVGDHQQELENQLSEIEQQFDLLQNHYQDERCPEHPLFSRIDVWQHDSIEKIIETAERARDELRELLNQSNQQKKIIFSAFNEQLQNGRQMDHYTEKELDQWKEQLMDIKKQLETPCDIELMSDRGTPPIRMIKIKSAKDNPLLSQQVTTSEQSNFTECCPSDEFDKSKSSISEISIDCSPVLEPDESSTILKEEVVEIYPMSCSASSFSLDPMRNKHLVLLQLSSNKQSLLRPILDQLTNDGLDISNDEEECFNRLQSAEQTTVFIDLFETSLNEENCFLDRISQLENVYFIYIRGNPSEDDHERADFFRRYSKIKAVFDNEQRLMVQWAIDTAAEFRKTGDTYVEMGDKEKGRHCFEQGIALYKQLSVFLNEKRRVR